MINNRKSDEEVLKEWNESRQLRAIQREKEKQLEYKLKAQLEKNIHANPNNIDLLLRLALFELQPPEGDPDKCIEYLNQVLRIDKDNVIALLFFAHLHEYVILFIPDELLEKIEGLHTDNPEYNAMLKYVASWSYGKFRKNNPGKEEKLLKESIEMWPHHVWNYFNLAELYAEQGQIATSKQLAQKALINVQKIYLYYAIDSEPTTINEFLNADIKGIFLTVPQLEIIKELL